MMAITYCAIAPQEELQQAYPGADIFLNGELTVDFPEDEY